MNGVRVDGAPVEQPQRQAEIGIEHEVGVARHGVGDGAEMDDGVELAVVEPVEQLRRRHHVGELPLAEVAPFLIAAEMIVDDDVGAPGLVQARDHVGPDEPGPAGDQKHPLPRAWVLPCLSLCPSSGRRCNVARRAQAVQQVAPAGARTGHGRKGAITPPATDAHR